MIAFMVVFWLALCIIVAIAAERRFNRDPIGWLALAAIISPLLAVLLLFAVGPKEAEPEYAQPRYTALAKSRNEPSQQENLLAFGIRAARSSWG